MEMIPSPRLGFLSRVFLANHLASTDNLTRTTKRQNTYQQKLTMALISNDTIKALHLKMALGSFVFTSTDCDIITVQTVELHY